MNISFNFLYRDGANYKNRGAIIVSNPDNHQDLSLLERKIRSSLFSTEFFYPDHLQLPDLHFEKWDSELDHGWYEFGSLEFTSEPTTDARTIDVLIQQIAQFAQQADLSKSGM